MTQKLAADLKAEISADIADNNTGDITASDMRTVLTDIIDSTQSKAQQVATPGTAPQAADGVEGDIQYDGANNLLYIKTEAGWKSVTLS